jgi:Bacterial antitoxin of type II TA system, VapB
MSMRTTINLDDALLAEAKQVAARTGRMTAVVEDALRQSLHRRHLTTRPAIELPVFGEGGMRPGVDLDDSAALLEVMEPTDPIADDAAR